jgi:hypothetical protein
MRGSLPAGVLVVMLLITGCAATTPNYDPRARESFGKIVAKDVAGARTQATADSHNPGPAFVGALGVAGLMLGDALQEKTKVAVYEYRVRTEDGRLVSVYSDFANSRVGDCVKLLESSQPSYPRFISDDGCR